MLTWRQSQTYTDSVTLWRTTAARNPGSGLVEYNLGCVLLPAHPEEAKAHLQKALQIQPAFADAHNNLGNLLLQQGQVDEAIAHFQEAQQIQPDFADALSNLGGALLQKGRTGEAIAQFQKALEIDPNDALTRYNLGSALLKSGRLNEAIPQFQSALEVRPEFAEACAKLGMALLQKGQEDAAMAQFRSAVQLNPNLANVQSDLGTLLLKKGRVDEAVAHYQAALAIQPGNAFFLNNLAWLLATSPSPQVRNGPRAVELAQQAERLGGAMNPAILGTLAAAYAEAGRFPEAVSTAQHALELATAQTNSAQVDTLRASISLYQAGSPFRDASHTNAFPKQDRP
jgi:tetratricopeptide (TPR) repeat protein